MVESPRNNIMDVSVLLGSINALAATAAEIRMTGNSAMVKLEKVLGILVKTRSSDPPPNNPVMSTSMPLSNLPSKGPVRMMIGMARMTP